MTLKMLMNILFSKVKTLEFFLSIRPGNLKKMRSSIRVMVYAVLQNQTLLPRRLLIALVNKKLKLLRQVLKKPRLKRVNTNLYNKLVELFLSEPKNVSPKGQMEL
mmetsp:Transcript_12513/g.17092  ORF Transcript_12513/g.17092 Transcript_12513/m.17092 type:complete len:105 (+) Transcript_12513:434-748(+)